MQVILGHNDLPSPRKRHQIMSGSSKGSPRQEYRGKKKFLFPRHDLQEYFEKNTKYNQLNKIVISKHPRQQWC